ncbi:hypothetical protein BDW74DRAFT_173235 [Aspergillus multicolor]|uniref:uncharacterized protein n=1 Tax=Aspergillus multicolor TaxID=41759 RepID=UPI003CCD7292
MGLLDLSVEVIFLIISYLDYDVSQRNGGYTLEWAAINGSVSTVCLILGVGASPDACGRKDWQPFALAAIHGQTAILEMLFERGVDPFATDWKNHSSDGAYGQGLKDWHPLSLAASEATFMPSSTC